MEQSMELPAFFVLCKYTSEMHENFGNALYKLPPLKQLYDDVVREQEEYSGKRKSAFQALLDIVTNFSLDLELHPIIHGQKEDEVEEAVAVKKNIAVKQLLGAIVYMLWKIQNPTTTGRKTEKKVVTIFANATGSSKKVPQLQTRLLSILKLSSLDALHPFIQSECVRIFIKEMRHNDMYKNFSYFVEDKDFFVNLEKIIENQSLKTQPYIDSFAFATQLSQTLMGIQSKLYAFLTKEIKNPFQGTPLLQQELYEKIKNMEVADTSKDSKTRFLSLMKGMENSLNMEKFSWPTWSFFCKEMELWIIVQSTYALCGAYYLLYTHSQASDSQLFKKMLLGGLQFESQMNFIDKDILYSLQMLKDLCGPSLENPEQIDWNLYHSKTIRYNEKSEMLFWEDCDSAIENLKEQLQREHIQVPTLTMIQRG